MKLGGHMGHGPNSSYHDVWHHMSCCHWIVTENDRKNGQMNVRIVKSQEEMGKIHSYHDTWLPALNIFLYKIFLNFFQIFTKFGREDHNGELLEPSLKIFWFDLIWLGHVTLNLFVRSLYIEKLEVRLYLCISKQAFVLQAQKAGSNHYFMI